MTNQELFCQAAVARSTAVTIANDIRSGRDGYTVADMYAAIENKLDLSDSHGFPVCGDTLKLQGMK